MTLHAATWWLAALVPLAALFAAGCSHVPWRKVPLDASAGFYKAASLTYRVDAGRLHQPLDVTRVEGQRVVYDQVASSPLPDQSIGTLTIAASASGRPRRNGARQVFDRQPAAETENGDQHEPVQTRAERSRQAARRHGFIQRVSRKLAARPARRRSRSILPAPRAKLLQHRARQRRDRQPLGEDRRPATHEELDPIPELDALAGASAAKASSSPIAGPTLRAAPPAGSSPAWLLTATWWRKPGEGIAPGVPPRVTAFTAVPPPVPVAASPIANPARARHRPSRIGRSCSGHELR